jgi:hypothetical protein
MDPGFPKKGGRWGGNEVFPLFGEPEIRSFNNMILSNYAQPPFPLSKSTIHFGNSLFLINR